MHIKCYECMHELPHRTLFTRSDLSCSTILVLVFFLNFLPWFCFRAVRQTQTLQPAFACTLTSQNHHHHHRLNFEVKALHCDQLCRFVFSRDQLCSAVCEVSLPMVRRLPVGCYDSEWLSATATGKWIDARLLRQLSAKQYIIPLQAVRTVLYSPVCRKSKATAF